MGPTEEIGEAQKELREVLKLTLNVPGHSEYDTPIARARRGIYTALDHLSEAKAGISRSMRE